MSQHPPTSPRPRPVSGPAVRSRCRFPACTGLLVLLLGAGCAHPAPTPGPAVVPAPTAGPPLLLDRAAARAARQTAMAALSAYARPHASATGWQARLWPHLSVAAREAYLGTDPATIVVRTVTGPARLTGSSLPALARVSVPTDAGIYLVVLSRSPDRPRWQVERFIPPEVVS